ncbi:hypothetical protein RvY_13105 [Ramazzottius varieornatus]|uniref:Uncharacterized protein n=1 Tax=Ramazzottius varieornatus TaxID=947166 RepID=A0A1D1VVC6_RAMVA|nr:hypothetical protein RvY_13105 [Ramazzottius varieornatus]
MTGFSNTEESRRETSSSVNRTRPNIHHSVTNITYVFHWATNGTLHAFTCACLSVPRSIFEYLHHGLYQLFPPVQRFGRWLK